MIIKNEISSFDEFEAWSGGKDTLDDLTEDQKQRLFSHCEELFDGECTDSELNDYLWFERDEIYQFLGIDCDGNELGSEDWAKKFLIPFADDCHAVNLIGNSYNVVNSFLEEEYTESCDNDKDDVIEDFKSYVFEKWKEMVVTDICAWHKDKSKDEVLEWLEDNYSDIDDIPTATNVCDEYDEYVES